MAYRLYQSGIKVRERESEKERERERKTFPPEVKRKKKMRATERKEWHKGDGKNEKIKRRVK